ncbi:MAG: ABC transporter substrate-binding protein [Vicinamibacterales bacterium]
MLVLGMFGVIWWTSRPTPPATRAVVEAPRPARGGTLTGSIRSEPRSFNRLVARDFATDLIATLTQGKLVRVNRATFEVEPWLAEKWTSSPDGLVHTLTLREGLQWSDGVPFTSADVAFTFQAIADPKVKSVLASNLEIDGAPVTVATPDARTAVVTFPHPFGPGIRLLDNFVILPKHRLEAAAAAGTLAQAWGPTTPPAELAGMGPFQVATYEPGQRLTFTRNPHYWRKDDQQQPLPYLDRLVLEIVPDQNGEILGIESGRLDLSQQQLRAEDYASARDLQKAGKLRLLEAGVSPDPDVFFFNLRPAVWAKDPRASWLVSDTFRKALNHAIDREAYANTVFLGAAVPVHGPVSPGNKTWFWPDLPRYAFDRAKATALLTELGLANRDADPVLEDAAGREARFTMLIYKGNASVERGAQVLKDSWEKIGVAVDVVPLEQGALIERMLSGQFETIFFNYTATDPDPAMQRDFWLSSGSAHIWNIGQKTPATPWEGEMDALVTRQASATDQSERVRLFRDVQKVFSDHLPAMYFAAPRLFVALGPRVRNEQPAVSRPQLLWSADTLAVVSDVAAKP